MRKFAAREIRACWFWHGTKEMYGENDHALFNQNANKPGTWACERMKVWAASQRRPKPIPKNKQNPRKSRVVKPEGKVMAANIVAEFGGEKECAGEPMYQVLRVSTTGTNGWLFCSQHSGKADAEAAAKATAKNYPERRVIVAEIELPTVKA